MSVLTHTVSYRLHIQLVRLIHTQTYSNNSITSKPADTFRK